MDLVRGNDLMLGFLNRHELAEFRRLRDLALPNRFGVWLEDAEDFVAHMRIAAKQASTVEFVTLEWVDCFNHRRLFEPIGYVPPAEFEALYYQQAAVA